MSFIIKSVRYAPLKKKKKTYDVGSAALFGSGDSASLSVFYGKVATTQNPLAASARAKPLGCVSTSKARAKLVGAMYCWHNTAAQTNK